MAKHKFDDQIEDAVSSAFGNIDDLKEELQSWYDSLHENFQNGSKGEQLTEAISGLENPSQPDTPDCLSGIRCNYELISKRKMSRSDRRDECITILSAVIDACESERDRLAELDFNEDGELLDAEGVSVVAKEGEDPPMTEDQRDDAVNDIESFIQECESAKDEWEGVEFPGMFG